VCRVAAEHKPAIGEPLPNAHRAQVPKRKLHSYALHLAHKTGGPKARLWRAVFGITREDWRYAREQIIEGLALAPVLRIRDGSFVATYVVVVVIRGLNGHTGPVTTAWQLLAGDPHLVTAFPRV
jgi:hypothetical protein